MYSHEFGISPKDTSTHGQQGSGIKTLSFHSLASNSLCWATSANSKKKAQSTNCTVHTRGKIIILKITVPFRIKQIINKGHHWVVATLWKTLKPVNQAPSTIGVLILHNIQSVHDRCAATSLTVRKTAEKAEEFPRHCPHLDELVFCVWLVILALSVSSQVPLCRSVCIQ